MFESKEETSNDYVRNLIKQSALAIMDGASLTLFPSSHIAAQLPICAK